jgi:hypothetical protein
MVFCWCGSLGGVLVFCEEASAMCGFVSSFVSVRHHGIA